MGLNGRRLTLVTAAVLVLVLPPVYLLSGERRRPETEPAEVVKRYLQALYSRDFKQAYAFISSADRKLKPERVYVRERGSFHGFTQQVARKLAGDIHVRPVDQRPNGDRVHLKLALQLPDANEVAPLVFNWDEERLNRMSLPERRRILASLERLQRSGTLKTIEGEEDFVVVKENNGWKLFLDWAAGIRVTFNTTAPDIAGLEAQPLTKDTIVHPNELFTVTYKVNNRSDQDLFTRIVHRIEPQSLAEHLDIVECALLVPVKILSGEVQEYAGTYIIRGDFPEGTKELSITYEFKLER